MEKVLKESGIRYQSLLCVAKIRSWEEAELLSTDDEVFANLECRVVQQLGEKPKEQVNENDYAELGIDMDLMRAQNESSGMRCQVLINVTELAEQMGHSLSDDNTLEDFCDTLTGKKILVTIVRISIKEFSSKLQNETYTHIIRESTGNRSNCIKTARFGRIEDTDEIAENMITKLLEDLESEVCTPVLLQAKMKDDDVQENVQQTKVDRRNRR